MDSEISKIWEEVLRYASPLPIPGKVAVETTDTSESSPSEKIDSSLSTISSQNQSNSGAQIVENLDDSQSLIETLFAKKDATNHNPFKTLSVLERNDNSNATGNTAVQFNINNDGENNFRLPQDLSQTTAESLPQTTVIPQTLSGIPSPSFSDQISQLTQLQSIPLNKNDSGDVSDALATGLKMIQQGNELIAKALKLSSANKEVDLFHTYASLSPISMPGSVESVNTSNIPNDPEVGTSGSNIGDIREEIETAIALTEDNFVSSSSNISNAIENEIDGTNKQDIASDNIDPKTGQPKVKRRRRREKNPNPIPSVPILPPCRICDEKSSGFHYGANTCEACKGFFRRTLKKQEVKFACKCREEEKLAWKQGPYKNNCPACRYARCLAVGMSRNAIKIGRYTLNRKTENIREVKSLEAMDSLIDKTICSSVNIDNPPLLESSPSAGSFTSSAEAISFSEYSPFTLESPNYTASAAVECNSSCTTQSALSVQEIESIVADITEAHRSCQLADPSVLNRPKELVNQIHRKFLEDLNLREKVFGDMKPLSKEEYKEFYNATGIDIDGRQQALEEALQHFTKKIVQFVEYAKTIPGFSDLSTKDQASLIKYSRPEHVILAGYRNLLHNISPELSIITTPWGKEVHVKHLNRILPKDVTASRFKFATELRDIGLTVEEDAILRGIVVTFTDRCELENPEQVQEIQYKLVACLEHLLSLRQVNSRKTLYRILNMLYKFRDFTEREYKVTKELVFEWPCISSYKSLTELFN